ncbi:DUF554 family protein, partial [Candidatus Bathyarchaeota archaeon]|nr:DUF554 family protein [Candidatus Bathyarchaeota archaeon]
MQGTLVNAVAVVVGSLVGIFLRGRFPDRVKSIVFQGIGLVTLFIGFLILLWPEITMLLFSPGLALVEWCPAAYSAV